MAKAKNKQVDTDIMIEFDHVDMIFNIASEQLNNLKEYFIKLVKHQLFFEEFKALKDISFQIKRGEVYDIALPLYDLIMGSYRASIEAEAAAPRL